jgi:nitroreductase
VNEPTSTAPKSIDVATLGEDVRLLEGLRTTRAIRRLLPDPVPPALIRKVCEAATYAPSGGNRQPWLFIAVSEPERKRWIAERYRAAFAQYIAPAQTAAQAADYPDRKRRNQASALHLAEHMADVPVLLFVAGYTRRGQAQLQALMPCVQNLLLACRAVGLGASLTTMHRSFGEECDRWLGLPDNSPSCALIPIGWPRGKYGTPPRRPVDESLFWESYDAAKDPNAKSAASSEG